MGTLWYISLDQTWSRVVRRTQEDQTTECRLGLDWKSEFAKNGHIFTILRFRSPHSSEIPHLLDIYVHEHISNVHSLWNTVFKNNFIPVLFRMNRWKEITRGTEFIAHTHCCWQYSVYHNTQPLKQLATCVLQVKMQQC